MTYSSSSFLCLVTAFSLNAWAGQIYLLQHRTTSATETPEYSLRELGALSGARKLALPETGNRVLVLTQDGRVHTWTNDSAWSEVERLRDVTGIAAGTLHSVALTKDGTVWTWGKNDHGQLGERSLVERKRPTAVTGLDRVTMIAAGADYTLTLRSDGTVWAFGSNWTEIMPGEQRKMVTEPVQIYGLQDINKILTSGNRAYALDRQDRIWVWGASAPDASDYALREIRVDESDEAQAIAWRFATGQAFVAKSLSLRGTVVDVQVGWAVAVIAEEPAGTPAAVAAGESGKFHSAAIGTPRAASKVPRFIGSMGVVAAAASHGFYIKPDGSACACGSHEVSGALGDGSSVTRSMYVPVWGLPPLTAISAGFTHTLALTRTGTVWGWGDNEYGQLGDASFQDHPTPFPISSLTGIVAVSAGYLHNVIVRNDGTVWTWGSNWAGQLGDGTTTNRLGPVAVAGVGNAIAVAAGNAHSIALRSDGTVWTWGDNAYGQLGDGTFTSRATPVQVANLTGIVAITAGGGYSLALKSDGTVWGWGQNNYAQLGDGSISFGRPNAVRVTDLTGVSGIAASEYHSIAVKADGTVWAWGYNLYGQLGVTAGGTWTTPVRVSNFTGAVAVAAGSRHSMAMRADGNVWAWGANEFGQLGLGNQTQTVVPSQSLPCNPLNLSSVSKSPYSTRVTSGPSHGLAVTTGGNVLAWGANDRGQLGDGTTITRNSPVSVAGLNGVIAVETGATHTLAITANGTVRSWGSNGNGQLGDGTFSSRLTPATVQNLSEIMNIAAGTYHSLALRSDGTVWGWGNNHYGQVGDNPGFDRPSPAALVGVGNAVAVAAGEYHSMALRSDGTVWTWGYNGSGQLGDATYPSRANPGQVAGLTNVIAIAAGPNHSLALRSDGTVWAWGQNSNGQLGDGSTMSRSLIVRVADLTGVVAIAGGTNHSVAVKNDGTVWAWGLNDRGQLGDDTTINRAVPVPVHLFTGGVAASAGGSFSAALRADGYVWSWGDNSTGQFGVPFYSNSTIPIRGPQVGYMPPRTDFNGDGTTDLLWQNDTSREVHIWFLSGPSGSEVVGAMALTGPMPGWTFVGTGDFNSDTKPDLVWQNDASRDLQVWYMTGALSNFVSGTASLSGGPVPGWRCAGIADVNGDNKPDLLWQNDSNREVHVWYMGGPQGNQYLGWRFFSHGRVDGWTMRGVADFNGDGAFDPIWQNDTTRDVQVWYLGGAPSHTYLGSNTLSGGPVPGWTVRGAADFNKDGKPDIVWQNDSSRDTHIWYMGGPLGNAYLGGFSFGAVPGWTAVP